MEVSWLWLCVKKNEIWLRSRYMVWRVSKSMLTSVKAELWLNLKLCHRFWLRFGIVMLLNDSIKVPLPGHYTKQSCTSFQITTKSYFWMLTVTHLIFFLSEFRLKSDRNLVKWTNKSDILGYLTDRTLLSRDLETAFTSVSWV